MRTLAITVLIILFVGCTNQEVFDIRFSDNNAFDGFTVKGNNPDVKFNVVPDSLLQQGAAFFETNQGKVWLNTPSDIIRKTGWVQINWDTAGRKITLELSKQKVGCDFSLTAEPDTGIIKWGMNIAANPEEYFTGLFERTVDGLQSESWKTGIKDAMNIRGQEIDMIIKPTLSLYSPFYLSSEGYGLFINGTWPGHYDMCKTNPGIVKVEFEGPSFTGIIYLNDNPAEIVKAHSLHTGPTIVPPRWAFLPWRWRDNHFNNKTYYDGTPVEAPYNSMLVEDILMMKAYDIPCGLYWVDRPWAIGFKGYEEFEWDPEQFPNAEKMIEWIHKNDMKFMLWIAPWVTGEMRKEANNKGYSLPIKGPSYDLDSSNVALLDYTNPEACKWWQENGLEKVLKQGVDGFKLDRAEEIVPESYDVLAYNGKTTRELRNEYPVLYVKTVNESCKKILGDDFVLIPRAGYTGSSQYSGFWGGDIGSPPEGLRAAIIALQRSAVIGYPVWGSDIGGYWQGNLDREVCARWLAFGCFNPIMEVGPTEDRAPWDMDSVPEYDTELIAVWRLYAKIHAALADYSHKYAVEASITGMPIVRPLFLEYPEQKEAWNNWLTYKYGEDILVSAIWEKDKTQTSVYLPAGTRWIDAWEKDKMYEGGKYIAVDAPLHKIPIFIKEGSKVDLGDLNVLYNESVELAGKKPDLKKMEKEFVY